ncbi:MAG TPA: hypothetical protein VEK33_08120 [Terriglobales bacterium]|nr:hypothetical protein [Terriglobales bacterium]
MRTRKRFLTRLDLGEVNPLNESLCVVGKIIGKGLQSEVTTQLQVFRLVHHAHAPAADPAEDAVMGNRLPHGWWGCSHLRECVGR